MEYFAPLSSPKPKHLLLKNTLDIIKIDNGNLGVINYNNMIPVLKKHYKIINVNDKVNDEYEIKYHELLKNQLTWINKYGNEVKKKGRVLYKLYCDNKLPNSVLNRCCNYPLLEKYCK